VGEAMRGWHRLACFIPMILLDPLARPVIGHRGNRAHSPENTLQSMRDGVALRVDAVEFDLRVSRDGKLVVIHDPTLERTTNGSGLVALHTAAQLEALDAGFNFTPDAGRTFPWRGRGVNVPTFDSVVESLPRELPLIIELKTPVAAPLIREAIRRHGIAKRVIVAGFSSQSVHPLRGAGFALGASTPDVAWMLLPALLRLPSRNLPFQALCIPPEHRGFPLPIPALAHAARRAGAVTHIWTVNDPEEARRYWKAGVQGIISDDPAIILPARAALR
jgi:glycerophosphoryl diester phosphodiesterase